MNTNTDLPRWTNFFRDNEYTRKGGEPQIEHENLFSWRSYDQRQSKSDNSPSVPYTRPGPGLPLFGQSEIITGPCRHSPSKYNSELKYFAPFSSQSNQGRALPPIPVDDSQGKPRISASSEAALTQEYKRQFSNPKNGVIEKQRKRRKRSGVKTKKSKENSETSVVLTVSIRNGESIEKLKQQGLRLNSTSSDSSNPKSPVEKTFHRENSMNSNVDLVMPPKRRRRRRRRNSCILPMVVMTVLILGGLLAAVGVVLLRETDLNTSEDKLDMVLAETHMRILNKKFMDNMKNNSSWEFLAFALPFNDEVNDLFLRSNYSNYYYGSEVVKLRQGSVKSISHLIFKDTHDLRNPSAIENTIKTSQKPYTFLKSKALNIGSYVVDYDSIFVVIKPFKTTKYPKRPTFKGKESNDKKGSNTDKKDISTLNKYNDTSNDSFNTSISKSTSTASTSTTSTTTSTITSTFGTTLVSLEKSSTEESIKDSSTRSTTSILSTGLNTENSEDVKTNEIKTTSNPVVISKEESTIMTSTPSITSPGPTNTPIPSIIVSNITINTTSKNASVVCYLRNLEYWEYLTVEHVSKANHTSVIINITSDGYPDFPSLQYANRLFLDLRLGFHWANVTLNFTVQCDDDGVYKCKAYENGQVYTGEGEIQIKELPTKPNLTVPIEMVENRQIKHPIVCKANVGYPPGKLQWMIKPVGGNEFIHVSGISEKSSGLCGNSVQSEFVFTPSMEGNGTILKCQVINDHYSVSTSEKFSDYTALRVVPASVCRGVPERTTILHPYRCDKYINCTNEDAFDVYQCPEELCYDTKTSQCGQTGLILSNTTAFLNEGVTSITCRLQHVGQWSGIRIFKETKSGGKLNILKVKHRSMGEPDELITKALKHRFFSAVSLKRYVVEVTVWIYKLACEDEGRYFCTADVPFYIPDSVGFVQLIVKPEVPKLLAPVEIIDGRLPREKFVCKGNTGYPGGILYWEVKFPGRQNFTNKLPFTETSIVDLNKCSREVKKEFSFVPNPKFEGMELRCVVENENALSQGQRLVSEYLVHVIPADTCKSNSTDPLPHPSDCRQYIQCTNDYMYVQRCSQSLCFNPETLQCDLPEPVDQIPVDPNYPCRPNRNGAYFPHPVVCNMYIWCVGGREVIRRCPLGTLYRGEGQCTFDTDKNSHCYRSENTPTD